MMCRNEYFDVRTMAFVGCESSATPGCEALPCDEVSQAADICEKERHVARLARLLRTVNVAREALRNMPGWDAEEALRLIDESMEAD